MKHLKKIFESVYEEIDLETLKSFIEDIEDEFKINLFIEDSKVYVSQNESEVVLIISKNNPSKDDYYKILMSELEVYKDESDYSDILLEKNGSNYFIIFSIPGSNPEIQEKYLKYFMENCFTNITYDELIIINNNSLKLKNPKCDFIKFKI